MKHKNWLTSSSGQSIVHLDIMECLVEHMSEGDEVLVRPMAFVEHLDGLFDVVTVVAIV